MMDNVETILNESQKVDKLTSQINEETKWKILSMAQYAIAFDLETNAMKQDGLSESDRTKIYQTETPKALSDCRKVLFTTQK